MILVILARNSGSSDRSSARQGQDYGLGGVGQEHADVDAGGPDAADADLVERFLDDTVQRLAGHPGEVDRDVLAGEGLLHERADAY